MRDDYDGDVLRDDIVLTNDDDDIALRDDSDVLRNDDNI